MKDTILSGSWVKGTQGLSALFLYLCAFKIITSLQFKPNKNILQ